jgi:hypothetical protein
MTDAWFDDSSALAYYVMPRQVGLAPFSPNDLHASPRHGLT